MRRLFPKVGVVARGAIIGAVLVGIAWVLTSVPLARELARALAKSPLEVLALALLVALGIWWWRQRQVTRILPFQNLTGDKSYDGIAAGFASLLAQEIERINRIRSSMGMVYGREVSAPARLAGGALGEPISRAVPPARVIIHARKSLGPGSLPTGERALKQPMVPEPFARVGIATGGGLGGALAQVGAIGVGPISLPLGSFLNLALSALQGRRVSGSFQRHGSILTIVINCRGRGGGSWQIRSDSLPPDTQEADQLIHELARQLAHMMVWETTYTTASDWRSFQEWVNGLDHYRRYQRSGRIDIQALKQAQDCFEKAIILDRLFALAHHNLGVVYDEQGMTRTAIETYRQAIELAPRLPEAHFNLALAYHSQGKIDEALDECQRAVDLKPDFSTARLHLGYLLNEKGDRHMAEANRLSAQLEQAETEGLAEEDVAALAEVRHAQYEIAADLYRKAVNVYGRAIKDYQKELKAARRRRTAGNGEEDDPAVVAGRTGELVLAWHYLGNVYSKLAGASAAMGVRKEPKRSLSQAERAFKMALQLDPRSGQSWADLGSYYANLGDYQTATEQLIKALDIEPDRTEIHKDLGKLFLDWSDRDLVALGERLESAVEAWPDTSWIEQGMAVEERLRLACTAFEGALATEPQDWETWSDLAMAHMLKGFLWNLALAARGLLTPDEGETLEQRPDVAEFNCAIALLGKALALKPDADEVYNGLALLYQAKGALEPSPEELPPDYALTLYERALAMHDEDYKAPDRKVMIPVSDEAERIAWAYHSLPEFLGVYSEVGPDVLLSLEEGSEARVYLWTLGWWLIRQDVVAEGLRQMERAQQMATDEFLEAALTHHELGLIYRQEQRWEEAIAELEAARSFYPLPYPVGQPLQLLLDLADAHFACEQYEEAIKVCTEVIKLAEDDLYRQAEALAARGQAHLACKKYAEAMRDCQEAARLVPTYAFPHLILALVYMEMLDYDRAIEAWGRVVELTPDQPLAPYHHEVANAYRAKGLDCDDAQQREALLEKAIQEYRKAITLYVDEMEGKARAHADLALVLADLERLKEASLEYERALALAKDSPDAYLYHMQIANVYVKRKSFTLAEEHYRKAIELGEKGLEEALTQGKQDLVTRYKGDLAEARNLLAYYLYAEQGVNLEEGEHLIKQALEAATDNETRGAYLDTQAWIYYKQGKYDEAIRVLEQAISLTMGTVEERYHLAMAYEQKAESCEEAERADLLTQARAQWEHVLDIDPESKWGKIARQRLSGMEGKGETND